jgi:hypothetical protein
MEDVFAIANALIAIGTVPLLLKVLRNKDSLKDFDLKGSLLTTTALGMMGLGYQKLGMFSSLLLLMPTLSYWAIISFYGTKSYIAEKQVFSKLSLKESSNV